MATLRVPTRDGDLVGEVTGDGPRVLVLHGGPGLSDYLAPLAAELDDGFTVAHYTQRGLAPSTEDGDLDVAAHVADAIAVVDHLGWHRPILAGHSWGGHLAMHVLARHPDRFSAGLVIDPLGAIGDGRMAEFGAEMDRRVPAAGKARLAELNAQEERDGSLPNDLALEQLGLYWPAYFPEPESAPPMPDMRIALRQMETWHSMVAEMPGLEARLTGCPVPTTFVHGGSSPMPLEASTGSAAVMADARVEVVDGAGHFIWMDVPGAVRRALDALAQRAL